jgi:hypothetical protein
MKKVLAIGALVIVLGIAEFPFLKRAVQAESQPTVSDVAESDIAEALPANPSASTTVEVIDPGAEPRQILRFAIASEQTQTVTSTMDMSTTVEVGGQRIPVDMPAMVMTMEVTSTPLETGDIQVQFTYSGVGIVPDVSDPNAAGAVGITDMLRSQLQQLVGTGGTYIIDPQGQARDFTLRLPEGLEPSIAQMMRQFSNAANFSTVVFPEVALGEGATWQVTSADQQLGFLPMDGTTTYEVTDLQDGRVTLNFSANFQADPQPLDTSLFPGLPANFTMNVRSLTSQGTGSVVINLEQVMPVQMDSTASGDMDYEVVPPQGQAAIAATAQSLINLTLESVEVP